MTFSAIALRSSPHPAVAGGADEAARPCDSGKRRFRREADRLEAHGRRAQADRIAARHPCAGDAFPLQPSFIWVGRGCYRFAARTVGWTRYEGEKNGEENSRRAVAGVGCCLCPCGCVGSLHWLPPSSPRLRSPLPSLLPVIPAATPTAEPFPAVGFSSFGANPDFCTCGRNDYDGGFGSTYDVSGLSNESGPPHIAAAPNPFSRGRDAPQAAARASLLIVAYWERCEEKEAEA